MTVDPHIQVALNCIVAVAGAVAGLTVPADVMDPHTAVVVIWGVGLLGTVANALLAGLSSAKPGPLVRFTSSEG